MVAGVTVIDIDPLTLIIILAVICIAGYLGLRAWTAATKQGVLSDKRGFFRQLFEFNRLPTVPTIRIVNRRGVTCLELGKRAKIRENSLKDSNDKKGWDIEGSPIPIIEGKNMELGYITHPAGCTVELRPVIKQIRADEGGNPVFIEVPEVDESGKETGRTIKKPDYIEANFEGVIGNLSDLDDFNESTERETSRGWVLPLMVGLIIGVLFLAPLFAWLMRVASGA